MKLFFLIIGSVLLASCNIKYEPEIESEPPAVVQVVEESITSPKTTFSENVLENEHFILTIEKSEIIQSPLESSAGLFVTYNLTNKSNEEEILPLDTLLWMRLEQKNETSRIILDSMYHFLDAFGDDTKTYNEMVNKSNSRSDYLLPGKTIELVEAYTLDNTEYPVTFVGLDYETYEEVGNYIVNLTEEASSTSESTFFTDEEESIEDEVYEVAEEATEDITVATDSSEAVRVLSDSGFTVTETYSDIIAVPLTSGISQGIWLATQNNDADGYLSSVIHPIFIDVSTYSGGKIVYLYSYEGDLILSAEDGVITYSIA